MHACFPTHLVLLHPKKKHSIFHATVQRINRKKHTHSPKNKLKTETHVWRAFCPRCYQTKQKKKKLRKMRGLVPFCWTSSILGSLARARSSFWSLLIQCHYFPLSVFTTFMSFCLFRFDGQMLQFGSALCCFVSFFCEYVCVCEGFVLTLDAPKRLKIWKNKQINHIFKDFICVWNKIFSKFWQQIFKQPKITVLLLQELIQVR